MSARKVFRPDFRLSSARDRLLAIAAARTTERPGKNAPG